MNTTENNQSLASWHFPRRQVAQSYLKTLSSGVLLSTTVYAPPQTGLTHFFINDVISCAQDDKYVPIYIDLSNPAVPVTAAVLMGLERVLAGSSVIQTGFNFIRGIFQSKEYTGSRVDGYLKSTEIIDPKYFIENKEAHFLLIADYFNKLLSYKSLLVLIDHAHQLGKDDFSREFGSYFRSLISKNSHSIRPLYGTNSMNGWSGVFENRRSALYSEGAFVHKLPHLGKVFLRDAMYRFGHQVSMEEMIKCFEIVGSKPGIFIGTLMGWKESSGVSVSRYFYDEFEDLKNIKNNSKTELFDVVQK